MSLRAKTITGLKWTAIESMFVQIVQFSLGIVLARLLSPSEFGLMGIVIIFTSVADTIVNSGYSQGLIRKTKVTDDDYKTVFIINVTVSLVIYTIIFTFADAMALYFFEEELALLLRIGGIGILLNSLTLVQRAYLTRNMEFATQTKITMVASLSSGVLGISGAFLGFGVYSLLLRTLSQSTITTFLFWRYRLWIPTGSFSYRSFRELFNYGSKILASSLLETLYQNVYNFVIAKFYSKTELGYYSRAQQFQTFITTNLMNIIGKTSFPSLSILQDDLVKFKNVYQRMLKLTFFVSSVLLFTLFNSSDSLIAFLLGVKWEKSAVYLRYISLLGLFYPLAVLNLAVLQIKGRSDIYLIVEILKKILAIPVIMSGIYFGIENMLRVAFLTSSIGFFINSYWTKKLINYSFFEQLSDILIYMLVGLLSSGLLMIFFYYIAVYDIFNLLINILVTFGLFYILIKKYDRGTLIELKDIIFSLKSKTLQDKF